MKSAFYIPENLPPLADSPALAEKFHYILDMLYLRRTLGRYDATDYLGIHLATLQKIISARRAKPCLASLVTLGVLECDNEWHKGGKSTGYRFAEPFREAKFRKVAPVSPQLAAQIEICRAEANEKVIAGDAALTRVKETVEKIKFEPAVRDYLASLPDDDKKASRRTAIDNFGGDGLFFRRDKSGGRFYHNFVTIARDLRQFARLDGQQLYQVDISACHPGLLAVLYDDAPTPELQAEKAKYVSAMQSGFYEFLAARMTTQTDLTDNAVRDAFKKSVMKDYIFCSTAKKSDVRQAFEKAFPLLAALIFEGKGAEKGIYKKHKRKIAIRLQKLEADMIFSAVIPRLIARYPDIPVVSMHDAVISTLEYVPAIREEMERAFVERVGFTPKVKTSRV